MYERESMNVSRKCRYGIVGLFMLITMCFVSALTVSAATKEDGANWACARANEGWCRDMDGAYGCQCVDLILAYYDYLGVSRASGNACDYRSNNLPSGWTRIWDKNSPQIGDVVVWGPGASIGGGHYANGTYGHIGIIKGVNADGSISTVETNAGRGSAAYYYQRTKDGVACYIRPNWGASMRTDYVNKGDSFDAIILRNDGWIPIRAKDNNVELDTEKAEASFHWHFQRQSDGSYIITSLYDGRALDVTGAGTAAGTNVGVYQQLGTDNGAQKWYIFGTEGNYELAPKCAMAQRLDTAGGYKTPGTNIQIYTANGSNSQKFAIYTSVNKGPTAISLSGTTTLQIGDKTQLKVTYSGPTGNTAVKWESMDPTVATVDQSGTVTALKAGTMTIRAVSAYNDRVSGSITLTVQANDNVAPVFKDARVVRQDDEQVVIEAEAIDNKDSKISTWSVLSLTDVKPDNSYVFGTAHYERETISDTKVKITLSLTKGGLFGDRHGVQIKAYDSSNNGATTNVFFTKTVGDVFTMKVGETKSFASLRGGTETFVGCRILRPKSSDVISVAGNTAGDDYMITALKPGRDTVIIMRNRNGEYYGCTIQVVGEDGSTGEPEQPTKPSNPSVPTNPSAPAKPSTRPSTSKPSRPSASSASTSTASTGTASVSTVTLPIQVKQGAKLSGLAGNDKIIGCTSSNNKVLTVSQSGALKAKKTGKAVVTMRLASGKIVKVVVNVQKKKVTTLKITNLPKKVNLKRKAKLKLKPVIAPITSKDKVVYKSSNKKVATVSKNGVIKAKKAGKATITVKSGKKTIKIRVTVKK